MSQRKDLVGELRRFAQRVPPPWLLAVSGGRDSMALLGAAQKLGLPFSVATVNHGMREEAADETALVAAHAPGCHVITLKPPKAASLAWAREARYAALKRIAKKRVVLTAHQRDDWIETLLLQALRGTSPDAWASFNRPGVERPFLHLPRTDLEHFVQKHRLPYVDDPSNRDPSHPRTQIRHKLVPLLHTLAPPGWEERFCRLASDVASDSSYLASLLPPLRKQLDLAGLPEPLQRRAVWRWLGSLSQEVQRVHVDATLELLDASSAAFVKLPGGGMVRRRGKKIAVMKGR